MFSGNESYPFVKTSLEEVTNKIKNPPCRIFFKNEYLQPSGSFKLRGIGYKLKKEVENAKNQGKKVRVFSSSGGNAGIAAAFTSNYLKVPCTVVLPNKARANVVEILRNYGADVIKHGNSWAEADEFLRENCFRKLDDNIQGIYCHPFDDPDIWIGHSTMIDEIVEDLSDIELKKVRACICSVGGGGLYNGIVSGLENNIRHFDNVEVISVETTNSAAFKKSIDANNKQIFLTEINTVASSLGASYVCKKALDNYTTFPTQAVVVEDEDTIRACLLNYEMFSTIVEPACGAALSLVLNRKDVLERVKEFESDDILIVVVCGGSLTDENGIREFYNMVNES